MNQTTHDQPTLDAFEELNFVVSEPFLTTSLKIWSLLVFLILFGLAGYLGIFALPFVVLCLAGLIFSWVLRARYHFDLFEMSYKNDYKALAFTFGGEWKSIPKPNYYTTKMETTRYKVNSAAYGYDTGVRFEQSVWKVFVHSPRGKAYLMYEHADKSRMLEVLSAALNHLDLPVYSGIKREDRIISRAGIHNGKLALVSKATKRR